VGGGEQKGILGLASFLAVDSVQQWYNQGGGSDTWLGGERKGNLAFRGEERRAITRACRLASIG